MTKILITDLQETLIPYSTKSCELLYGINTNDYYQQIIYERLKEQLDPFFKMGNKMVIVTSPSHMSLDELIDNDIKTIYATFKEYEDSIEVYLNSHIIPFHNRIPSGYTNDITFISDKEKVFDYIEGDYMLEQEPFDKITQADQMRAYKYDGFWQCMDTVRDKRRLESLWQTKKAPWKLWQDKF